jgi:hypothetical protein
MKLFITIITIALSASLSAQAQPNIEEPTGWDRVKFGMTLDEVRAAYQATKPPEVDKDSISQYLKSVMVGDIPMEAIAVFNRQSKRAESVILEWKDSPGDVESRVVKSQLVYLKLLEALRAKYGRHIPTGQSDNDWPNAIVWHGAVGRDSSDARFWERTEIMVYVHNLSVYVGYAQRDPEGDKMKEQKARDAL